MILMPGEEIIRRSDTGLATLTTHRLRFEAKSTGNTYLASIMLEEICSCELTHKSNPLLLLLSLLLLIAGISLGYYTEPTYIFIGVILAVIFLIAFFMFRKGFFSIKSAGAPINFPTSNKSFDSLSEFIDEIEEAKNQRYLIIRSRNI
jgi:hypothetical protein